MLAYANDCRTPKLKADVKSLIIEAIATRAQESAAQLPLEPSGFDDLFEDAAYGEGSAGGSEQGACTVVDTINTMDDGPMVMALESGETSTLPYLLL